MMEPKQQEKGVLCQRGSHLSVLPGLLFSQEKTECGFLSETVDSIFKNALWKVHLMAQFSLRAVYLQSLN